MKFTKPIPVSEIAATFGAKIVGDSTAQATGINEINKVEPGDITFVDVRKYFAKSLNSAATIILINEEVPCPAGKILLVCEKPFEVYNNLVLEHRPLRSLTALIHHTAKIHPSAVIEPNVVIGPDVEIGPGTWIQSGVVIREFSLIGAHVRIQSGTVIGSDAFYYKKHEWGYEKWQSCGRVIIQDHADIGSNCTINKGVSGDTIIGEGSKLDCLIHVGHGAVIGKHCLFAAQVGIGGKTIIGDHVTLYGQVGVAQRLRIGNHVTVLAQSGVGKDLEDGKTYFGSPCQEVRKAYKEIAALRQLPGMLRSGFEDPES